MRPKPTASAPTPPTGTSNTRAEGEERTRLPDRVFVQILQSDSAGPPMNREGNNMSTVQLPAPPQEKKRRVWLWVVGAIVALIAISTATAETWNAPTAPVVPDTVEPIENPYPDELIVTAPEFVDVTFNASDIREFCTAYFGLGNDDVAFRAFESGAGPDVAGIPTNRAVFDELVWRCVS